MAAAICNAEAALYEEKYRYADFDEPGKDQFRAEADRLLTALEAEGLRVVCGEPAA